MNSAGSVRPNCNVRRVLLAPKMGGGTRQTNQNLEVSLILGTNMGIGVEQCVVPLSDEFRQTQETRSDTDPRLLRMQIKICRRDIYIVTTVVK